MKRRLYILACFLGLTTASHAQYCTSGGPSSTIDSNVESVVLMGDNNTINYTGCPGLLGVEDQTALSADLTIGNSYTATIQFGTCGNNYTGAGEAWIDFDGDEVFDVTESIGTWQGIPPTAISNFNFTVPLGTCNGSTRMRVMHWESGSVTPPLDPCGAFTWGSVVDFTIDLIGGGVVCNGVSTTTNSNVESVDLIGETSNISYTGCPGVLGIENQCVQIADMAQGETYSLNVQFGTCGANMAGAGQAWIDWDQDGLFDISETVGTWTGTPPTALSVFSVFVPGSATLGNTKMRVKQEEGGSIPLNADGVFNAGSVVDFAINIVACPGLLGDDVTTPIEAASLPYSHSNNTAACYSDQWPAYLSADVFYMFIVSPNAQEVKVSLCNSSFDTHLTILNSSQNVIGFNDDGAACSGGQSEITVSAVGEDTMYAIVEGWNTSTGAFDIEITEGPFTSIYDYTIAKPIIEIYPNPSQETFFIKSLSEPIIRLEILDMQGRKVYEEQPMATKAQVLLPNLASGQYVSRVTLQDNRVVHEQLSIEQR